MFHTYEINRMVNGVPTPDIVMLVHPDTCDLPQALHDLGMKYCMTKQGQQLCRDEGGLTLERLLDYATPEMLEAYGIVVIRPKEIATRADQEPPVIGKYEVESYLRLRDNYIERFRRLYDGAKRFARHLESKQTKQHPVVAGWDGEKVTTKALVWAYQFVAGSEKDWHKFVKNRLAELTTDTHGNDADSFPFEEETVGEVPITQ